MRKQFDVVREWKCLVAFATCLLLLSGIPVSAQSAYDDSLYTIFKSGPNDSVRLSAINKLVNAHRMTDPEKAFDYADQAIELARTSPYNIGLSLTYMSIGLTFQSRGDFDSALIYLDSANYIAANQGDTSALAAIANNIGLTYMRSSELDSSLVYLLLALKYKENLGPGYDVNRAFTLGNIASIYYKKDELYMAYETFLEVASIFVKFDQHIYLAQCFSQISQVFIDMELPDSAMCYINKSDSILKIHDSKFVTSLNFQRYGETLMLMGEYQKAIKELKTALSMFEEMGALPYIAVTKYNLAKAYLNTGNIKKSIDFAKSSIKLATDVEDEPVVVEGHEVLAHAYKAKGEYKLAYETYQKYHEEVMEIRNREREDRIDDLTAKYESLKKEYQIRELTKANEIAQLEAEKSLSQRNYITIIAFTLVLLLATFILWLIGRLRNRTRMEAINKKLHEQQLSELEKTQKLLSAKFMIEGQEKERERIARDLHDDIGSQLAAIKLHIETTEPKKDKTFDQTITRINNAYEDVRRISHNLMPMSLSKAGLPTAIRDLSHNISTTKKLHIDVQTIGLENRLDSTTEVMLFRIIQEAMKNIIRHAEAQKVVVQLINDGNIISLTIEDDGKGFDINKSENTEGLGMKSMKSRVEFLNGKMDIKSKEEEGTSIYVEVGV